MVDGERRWEEENYSGRVRRLSRIQHHWQLTRWFDLLDGIETDENDEGEVGVKCVSREERDEADGPRQGAKTTVDLQKQKQRASNKHKSYTPLFL